MNKNAITFGIVVIVIAFVLSLSRLYIWSPPKFRNGESVLLISGAHQHRVGKVLDVERKNMGLYSCWEYTIEFAFYPGTAYEYQLERTSEPMTGLITE